MTCEQGSGSYRWCVGFSQDTESSTEKRLGKLWQRLLTSVRSEEALAEATKGPRVGWNPYRPARGEHLVQGVLNSEVYEWRSTIHSNSLYITGTALSINDSPRSPANAVHVMEPLNMVASPAAIATNGLSSDRTVAQSSGRTRLSCDNDSKTKDIMYTEKNKDDILNSSAPRKVIDEVFGLLWRTVAVPWIMERYASDHYRPAQRKKGPEVHDRINSMLNFSVADCSSCFSKKSTGDKKLLLNRRRPTTGPALRRGGAGAGGGKNVQESPTLKKTELRVLHILAAAPGEKVFTEAKGEQPVVAVVKQGVHFPNELNHFPKQKRVSSYGLTSLTPFKNNETERGRALLSEKSTTRNPSLRYKKRFSSDGLHARGNNSPSSRVSSKTRQFAAPAKNEDTNRGNDRSSSDPRGRKLAPLFAKGKCGSPTIRRKLQKGD